MSFQSILLFTFVQFFSFSFSEIIIPTLQEQTSCSELCSKTYPLHTYDKPDHLCFCQRGCRLYSLINLVEGDTQNNTLKTCFESCKFAYDRKSDRAACKTGCSNQVPFVDQRHHHFSLWKSSFDDQFFQPMLYIHKIYSNMWEHMNNRMTVQWSYFYNSNNGEVSIVKSNPSLRFHDDTTNFLETSLRELDNSATPDIKHSQMFPAEFDSSTIHFSADERNGKHSISSSDWLECIARKTGLPRMLISFTIFLSATLMIWLCFITATSTDRTVKNTKLSIYGDLEYLTTLPDKKFITAMRPQDQQQAEALPIKLKIESI